MISGKREQQSNDVDFRMPWQGQLDNLIDRFDGRAYLDIDRIPVVPKVKEMEEISADERHSNYERYRILAQNDFLGKMFFALVSCVI